MQKKFQPVVLAIIKKDSHYLLTLRNEKNNPHSPFNGLWQLPGGGVEFGESLEEALIREVREELGVGVSIVMLVPKIIHKVRNKTWHGLFVCFLCRRKDENATIQLNEEASEWGWFTREEIRNLKKLDGIDEVITASKKM